MVKIGNFAYLNLKIICGCSSRICILIWMCIWNLKVDPLMQLVQCRSEGAMLWCVGECFVSYVCVFCIDPVY